MGPQFPTAVSACGGIYVQKDREVPDTYGTQIEYPKFFITLAGVHGERRWRPVPFFGDLWS